MCIHADVGCICSKHGFRSGGMLFPGDMGW